MSVAGGLGAAPIGHRVKEVHDSVAELDKTDDQGANCRQYIGRRDPRMGDGGATKRKSFFEPSHLMSLSGYDT